MTHAREPVERHAAVARPRPVRAPGRQLDAGERRAARAVAFSFADVRVRDDAEAASEADALGAAAFARGAEVTLGSRYRALDPVAREGVLLHELIHVAQRGSDAAPAGALSHADDAGEVAARETSLRIAARPPQPVAVAPRAVAAISRDELPPFAGALTARDRLAIDGFFLAHPLSRGPTGTVLLDRRLIEVDELIARVRLLAPLASSAAVGAYVYASLPPFMGIGPLQAPLLTGVPGAAAPVNPLATAALPNVFGAGSASPWHDRLNPRPPSRARRSAAGATSCCSPTMRIALTRTCSSTTSFASAPTASRSTASR